MSKVCKKVCNQIVYEIENKELSFSKLLKHLNRHKAQKNTKNDEYIARHNFIVGGYGSQYKNL